MNVYVDWDSLHWQGTHDYSQAIDDISTYVKGVSTRRGQKTEMGNTPAGTAQITLDNSSGRFSPPNTSSPLYGKMRPYLPVRIVGDGTTVYTGFISRITCYPNSKKQEALLYCTDGTDLLARQMARQQETERTQGTDGDAIEQLLNVAGWSASRRSIDKDGGNIVQYPKTAVF